MADNYVAIRIKADDSAKPDLTDLKAKLDELSHKVATARAEVNDKQADATLTRLDAKLAEIGRRAANPRIKMEGAQKALADLLAVDVGMDRLQEKADKLRAEADAEAAKGGILGRLLGGAASASGKGPWWLGPLLGVGAPLGASLGGVAAGAGIGLGGAAVAGAGAMAAFGAVAKPVLAQALTAEQAVQAAQDSYNAAIAGGTKQAVAYKAEQIAIGKAYAEMSPQQVALSKQLGDMGNAWQNLKAAQTPVIAGALQPWLKSVTDLTGKLGPIIGAVSPYIADLGTSFDSLINSDSFAQFRDFVASTGSSAVGAVGHTLIDFLRSMIVLLPQFTPLINGAVREITRLGPAVLNWASSQKTADGIQKFMAWFSQNGPAVGGLLKNIGGALKALAPGLGPAGTAEITVFSQFFGFIAKLPPGVAKPLTEVAAVLLTLNKLGVVNVGVKFLGLGGGAGGAADEAAAAGGAAGLWSKLLPGVRFASGILVATLVVSTVLKNTPSGPGGKNWWDNPFGTDPKSKDPAKQGVSTWAGLGHIIEHVFDRARHAVSDSFAGMRHDIAHIWDLIWNNTVGRLTRGLDDMDNLLGGWEHNVVHWFDSARHSTASVWGFMWGSISRLTSSGVSNVMHWIGTLPGRIGGLFSQAGSLLFNAGRNIIQGLINGITSMIGSVGSAMGGILGEVASFLPHSPAKKGPLSGSGSPDIAGRKTAQMFAQGLLSGRGGVSSAMARVTGSVAGGRPAGGYGGYGANSKLELVLTMQGTMLKLMQAEVRQAGGDPLMFQKKVAYRLWASCWPRTAHT